MMIRFPLALLLAIVATSAVAFENMNADYIISCTPNQPGCNAKFDTKWSEYPGGVEYFDTYVGPITSLYSQVCHPLSTGPTDRNNDLSALNNRTTA